MSGDTALLAALHNACFAESWTMESFASLMSTQGSFALLAGRDGQTEGFILVRAVAGEAEILSIGVVPPARRSGLARGLIAAAAARAYEEGARTLFLEVAIANAAARGLYEGLGFHQVGTRKAYYRQIGKAPEDAVILKVNLPLRPLGKAAGFD
ncbi:MAG: ribosomal protein S18-alanine N-acetyltransferase [Proteobacteria bacterium]|nr:ribosomal protein S18-alanine N-acetyltransferase [Pseudomonadota bacterium]